MLISIGQYVIRMLVIFISRPLPDEFLPILKTHRLCDITRPCPWIEIKGLARRELHICPSLKSLADYTTIWFTILIGKYHKWTMVPYKNTEPDGLPLPTSRTNTQLIYSCWFIPIAVTQPSWLSGWGGAWARRSEKREKEKSGININYSTKLILTSTLLIIFRNNYSRTNLYYRTTNKFTTTNTVTQHALLRL